MKVWILLLLQVAYCELYNVSDLCPHASITAPICENNSTLFAYRNKSKHNKDVSLDNCATCVCDQEDNDEFHYLSRWARGNEMTTFQRSWGRCCNGWNGTGCDICQNADVCPSIEYNGSRYEASDCSSGQVIPTNDELDIGKKFSCTPCGAGADNSYCIYTDVPGASLDIVAFEDMASIAMRVGRYTSGSGEHFYHQNFYEYAAMFLGELTDCSYSEGSCAWDDALQCLTLKCGTTNIDCPPAGLDECPGWTYDPCKHKYVCEGECVRRTAVGDCCVEEDSDDDDFYHGHRYHVTQPFCCAGSSSDECEVTELFWNSVPTTFSCQIDPSPDMDPGARRCYLNQAHTGVDDGFPYTCHVGNCMYNVSMNQTANFTFQDDDLEYHPQPSSAKQIWAVGLIALGLALAIFAGYQSSRLRARAKTMGLDSSTLAACFMVDANDDSDDEEAGAAQILRGWERTSNGNAMNSNGAASPQHDHILGDEGYNPMHNAEQENGNPASWNGGTSTTSGDLSWRRVTVQCPVKRFEAVRGATGSARRGQVTAILGPSGAGKSSLLKALGGRLAPEVGMTRGRVELGSIALDEAGRRRAMAFVPQDDAALPAALTVKEHLLFHAELRRAMSGGMKYNKRKSAARTDRFFRRAANEEAVRAVVSALDLSACGSRLIGRRPDDASDGAADGARGISGGEARRVSVAAELLGEPRVVLLDEPTSRLDARAALALAVALRRVSRGGAVSALAKPFDHQHEEQNQEDLPVVLASMHQPRAEIVFEALDEIHLLARGRVAWIGNVQSAVRLATRLAPDQSHLNPADVLMDAVDRAVQQLGRARSKDDDEETQADFRKAVALELTDEFDQDDDDDYDTASPKIQASSETSTRAPLATQLKVLVDRQLLRIARAPSLLLLHAGGCLAAGLCLGSIDEDPPRTLGGAQRRVEAIFFSLFFLALLALTALSAFREDAVVANSERAALGGLYSSAAQFISVVFVDIIALRVLPALILAAVTYPLVGLRKRCAGWCVLRFAASLTLTSAASGLAACALGSCITDASAANAVGALGVLAMALFGGVAVDVGSGQSNSDVEGDSLLDMLSKAVIAVAARCDALYYAFRAAVVGEFAGAEDGKGHPIEYVIDGHKCDPKFGEVVVQVKAILVTLDLPTTPAAADAALLLLALVAFAWLWAAALAHTLCSKPRFSDHAGAEAARRIRSALVEVSEQAQPLFINQARRTNPCCPCPSRPLHVVEIPSARNSISSSTSVSHPTNTNGTVPPSDEINNTPLLTTAQQNVDSDVDSDEDAGELLHGFGESKPAPKLECKGVTLRVVEWRRSAKKIKRTKLTVLDNCSFKAAPASVTCLLGPSGAGKSSLLDVIAGRRTTGKLEGSGYIRVDNVPTSPATLRQISRYCPQDDVLPPRLTAFEHLIFHARLRLPSAWPDRRKIRAANRELARLGLTKAYDFDGRATLLSRASGGQRRRVTIATELVAKNRLLFCDEPTTGLDAATALLACRRLRRVSRRGVTVVTVLHQPRPEIFWDAVDVLSLVVKGHVVFSGPPSLAAEKFMPRPGHGVKEALNPADAMLDAADTFQVEDDDDRPRAFFDDLSTPPPPSSTPRVEAPHQRTFDDDDDNHMLTANGEQSGSSSVRRLSTESYFVGMRTARAQEEPSALAVFSLLARRELRATSRDWPSLLLHYVPAAVIGLLLGVVYENMPSHNDTAAGIMDRFGLAFVLCTTVGLSALSAAPRARRAARLFARERDALRDTALPFFLASNYLGDAIPLRLGPPAVLAAIAALLSRCCESFGHAVAFVIAAVQLHYALAAIGRFIGALAPRDAVCAGASSLVLLFSLLLCGFFVSPSDLPHKSWKQIADLLPAKYGYEALNAHMFYGVDDLFIVSEIGDSHVRTGPYSGNTILRCFGLDTPGHAVQKHYALALFGIAADVATFFALKLFARERR